MNICLIFFFFAICNVSCSSWTGAKFSYYSIKDTTCSKPIGIIEIYITGICSEGDYLKYAIFEEKDGEVNVRELCDSKCVICNRTLNLKDGECFFDKFDYQYAKVEVVDEIPKGGMYFYDYSFLSYDSCLKKETEDISMVTTHQSVCGDCTYSRCPGGAASYLNHCLKENNYTMSYYESKDCSGDPLVEKSESYKCFPDMSGQAMVRSCEVLV